VPHRQCSAHIDSCRICEEIRGSTIQGAVPSGWTPCFMRKPRSRRGGSAGELRRLARLIGLPHRRHDDAGGRCPYCVGSPSASGRPALPGRRSRRPLAQPRTHVDLPNTRGSLRVAHGDPLRAQSQPQPSNDRHDDETSDTGSGENGLERVSRPLHGEPHFDGSVPAQARPDVRCQARPLIAEPSGLPCAVSASSTR
jgi:hypothetical protein